METKKDYTINENVKVLDGLTEALQEQVSMMKPAAKRNSDMDRHTVG